ncbi:hypothetical protein KIW84_046077 [Lathyrus oleraceus]|uniref:lipid-A-disaccharide synthase n=3 Tax=Pisum sativum TaxID=3888 RepID=A0A9D4XPZ1_PEA|nr:hypothetical protein KIW84_046077 [Pisum sativum]
MSSKFPWNIISNMVIYNIISNMVFCCVIAAFAGKIFSGNIFAGLVAAEWAWLFIFFMYKLWQVQSQDTIHVTYQYSFEFSHLTLKGATVISLLPGSRVQEVSRMLPIFANTMELLKDNVPQLMTIIHVEPNEHVENFIAGVVHRWHVPVVLIPGGTTHMRYDAFSASKVALCTFGTVAVELQLARLPCVVAYRAHILTEWFIRYKAKIQYMSLPNILLNSAIILEALFQSCEPANLALLLKDLIHDHVCREKQILSAQTFVKLLMPSERINQNLAKQSLTGKCPDYSPSAVAALTILNHGKPVIHD